jgi:D-alanyl-D-alanine carboxypeptidase
VTVVIAERLREQWLIQIGAYDDEEAAREQLRGAQRMADILSSRLAYTEPVKSDATTLYRARFSGFDKAAAQAACNELKKANFPCLPMRQ